MALVIHKDYLPLYSSEFNLIKLAFEAILVSSLSGYLTIIGRVSFLWGLISLGSHFLPATLSVLAQIQSCSSLCIMQPSVNAIPFLHMQHAEIVTCNRQGILSAPYVLALSTKLGLLSPSVWYLTISSAGALSRLLTGAITGSSHEGCDTFVVCYTSKCG